jgi:hypothetical protein
MPVLNFNDNPTKMGADVEPAPWKSGRREPREKHHKGTAWRMAILTLLPVGAHVQEHTDREIKQTILQYTG